MHGFGEFDGALEGVFTILDFTLEVSTAIIAKYIRA